MADENSIRKNIAENLTELRKGRGLTQIQLADIFGYSDKSVSKWERGDTSPDIETLHSLASYYGVTIDDLTHEGMAKEKINNQAKKRGPINFGVVALIASMVSIIVMINLYVVILNNTGDNHWTLFTWCIPICAFIFFIFNLVWGLKKLRPIFGSILSWTFPLALYLELGISTENGWGLWSIILLGAPLMIISILWDKIVSH